MRWRFLVPFGAVCVGLPVMVFIFPRLFAGVAISDEIGEYSQWQPTPSDIRQALGVGRDGPVADSRHAQFAHLFQQRFRSHQKAVGIKFTPDGKLQAKFAATIPRWDMANVSLQLHKEAEDVFGRDVAVDIYETYISMTPVKLAELRSQRVDAKLPARPLVEVKFDPQFAQEQAAVPPTPEEIMSRVIFSRESEPICVPNPIGWMLEARFQMRRAMMSRPFRSVGALPMKYVNAR